MTSVTIGKYGSDGVFRDLAPGVFDLAPDGVRRAAVVAAEPPPAPAATAPGQCIHGIPLRGACCVACTHGIVVARLVAGALVRSTMPHRRPAYLDSRHRPRLEPFINEALGLPFSTAGGSRGCGR